MDRSGDFDADTGATLIEPSRASTAQGREHLPPRDLFALGALALIMFGLVSYLVLWALDRNPGGGMVPPVVFGPMAITQSKFELPPPVFAQPALSVFFANKDSRLDGQAKHYLRRLARGLSQCADPGVELLGSASSALFADDPDDRRNVGLANERAESVRKLLELPPYRIEATVRTVQNLTRTYPDQQSGGGRPHPAQALNRRVDIFVAIGRCTGERAAQEGQSEVSATHLLN